MQSMSVSMTVVHEGRSEGKTRSRSVTRRICWERAARDRVACDVRAEVLRSRLGRCEAEQATMTVLPNDGVS